MSRLSSLTLAAAGLALAACADSPRLTEPARPAASTSPDFARSELNNPNRHVFLTREGYARALKPSRTSGTGISYHGGPVLQAATNVVAVYWANSAIYNGGPTPGSFSTTSNAGDGSLVGTFLRGLGGSPYFNINTTYTNGSGAHIANVVNYTGFWANNQYSVPSNGQSVSDAQMVAMLQYGFDHGYLTYDPHTLYHIFSAGTVNLGGNFGTQYCAYHTHGTVTINGVSQNVLYSAMPYDYAYPSSCSANLSVWPNGDAGADAEVNTLAHETEETTTDEMGNAWYDNRGYENADKCAWTWGTTANANGGVYNLTANGYYFLVQRNWVNAGRGGCATGY